MLRLPMQLAPVTVYPSESGLSNDAACYRPVQTSWRVSWFPQVLKGHGFGEAQPCRSNRPEIRLQPLRYSF